VVSDFGTRVGADGTLSRALGSAKENNYALESLKGYIVYIVWGCWELKTEISDRLFSQDNGSIIAHEWDKLETPSKTAFSQG